MHKYNPAFLLENSEKKFSSQAPPPTSGQPLGHSTLQLFSVYSHSAKGLPVCNLLAVRTAGISAYSRRCTFSGSVLQSAAIPRCTQYDRLSYQQLGLRFLFHLAVLCARLPFSNAWQSNITSYQITLKPTCLWVGLSRQRIEYGHDLYRQVGVSGQKCW